jgi:SPP1 gp7 family putative phage head morphogenesis protein
VGAAILRTSASLDRLSSRTAYLQALLAQSRELEDDATEVIAESRYHSARAGRDLMGKQILAVAPWFVLGPIRSLDVKGDIRAANAGRTVAARFGQAGLTVLGTSERDKALEGATRAEQRAFLAGDAVMAAPQAFDAQMLRRAIQSIPDLLKSKVATVAATESADALIQATRGVQREAAAQGVSLVVRWDATLDMRTCSRCESLHGRTAQLGEVPGGEEPPIHPNCRCVLQVELE